jgi:hypothetical protein
MVRAHCDHTLWREATDAWPRLQTSIQNHGCHVETRDLPYLDRTQYIDQV